VFNPKLWTDPFYTFQHYFRLYITSPLQYFILCPGFNIILICGSFIIWLYYEINAFIFTLFLRYPICNKIEHTKFILSSSGYLWFSLNLLFSVSLLLSWQLCKLIFSLTFSERYDFQTCCFSRFVMMNLKQGNLWRSKIKGKKKCFTLPLYMELWPLCRLLDINQRNPMFQRDTGCSANRICRPSSVMSTAGAQKTSSQLNISFTLRKSHQLQIWLGFWII